MTWNILLMGKKRRLRYDYWIVLNGDHDVPILGITGIGLKQVDYRTAKKHEGLRYWVAFAKLQQKGFSRKEVLNRLSLTARLDILSLIMGEKASRTGDIVF